MPGTNLLDALSVAGPARSYVYTYLGAEKPRLTSCDQSLDVRRVREKLVSDELPE